MAQLLTGSLREDGGGWVTTFNPGADQTQALIRAAQTVNLGMLSVYILGTDEATAETEHIRRTL